MISFFWKLRAWNDRRRKDKELGDELEFHLDEEAEERQAAGQTPEQARWAARRNLGSVPLIQEHTRRVWTWTLLEQLAQDLRYASRHE